MDPSYLSLLIYLLVSSIDMGRLAAGTFPDRSGDFITNGFGLNADIYHGRHWIGSLSHIYVCPALRISMPHSPSYVLSRSLLIDTIECTFLGRVARSLLKPAVLAVYLSARQSIRYRGEDAPDFESADQPDGTVRYLARC